MLNKDKFRAREQSGLGAVVFSDQHGPLETTGFILSYGYHIPFRAYTLSFGIAGSLANYRINSSLLEPTDPNDQALLDMPSRMLIPNANAGISFYGQKYFTGLSLTEIFPSKNPGEEFYSGFRPNIYFTGGYRMDVAPGIIYEPSVEIRSTKRRELVFDINSKIYLGNAHWTGLNLRSDGTFGLYLGLNIRNYIYVAYLYEYSFGEIRTAYNNTHTIMLGQNIGLRSFTAMRKMWFR